MNAHTLVRLLQFGDSTLPTGSFAFSSALEAAVQKHIVYDRDTLQQYVVSALQQASTGDAVGLVCALRALCADPVRDGASVSEKTLAQLRNIDIALYRRKLPEEFRDMMTKTGKKLAELGADMTDIPLLIRWVSQIRMGSTPGSYPVSLAVLSAASVFSDHPFQKGSRWEEDVLIQETLTMYFYSVAMGLLNASLRVMRITHVDVQRIMYRISSMFEELCRLAQETPLDRMTGYAPMTDILSAVHAGSHVRLFIS